MSKKRNNKPGRVKDINDWRLDHPGDNYRAQVHQPHPECYALFYGYLCVYAPENAARVRDKFGAAIEQTVIDEFRTLLEGTDECKEKFGLFVYKFVNTDAVVRLRAAVKKRLPQALPYFETGVRMKAKPPTGPTQELWGNA